MFQVFPSNGSEAPEIGQTNGGQATAAVLGVLLAGLAHGLRNHFTGFTGTLRSGSSIFQSAVRGRIGRRARAVRIVGRAGMTRGQGGRSGAAAPNNGWDALTEDP